MKITKIIIAVADTDLRLSLDLMLCNEPGLNVIGTAATQHSMLGLIKAEKPDLIVLEWGLCDGSVKEMLREIKVSDPDLKVILLGTHSNQVQLNHQLSVDAFLLIGDEPENLRSTIKYLATRDSETQHV